MNSNDSAPDPWARGRYREIQYHGVVGPVTIIQDTQNDEAWIQSTVTAEVSE